MNKIIQGNSLDVLKKASSDAIDLIVTDPPYGYSFMGKDWDKAVPSVELWQECLRVLKPGGFAFVMSAPRQDVLSQMIVRLGEAGFNTSFTSIYWTYASGFPKAMNIGKMVDKRLGTYVPGEITTNSRFSERDTEDGSYSHSKVTRENNLQSPEAKALEGSYGGFQPKPAVEVIIVAMKPLSEKTYVDQALKNGKGITWLDSVRIPFNGDYRTPYKADGTQGGSKTEGIVGQGFRGVDIQTDELREQQGRFPANLLVSDDVINEHSRYFDLDKWADTLPFLIVPKASKSEKNKGLEGWEEKPAFDNPNGNMGGNMGSKSGPRANFHPTVKPLKLMSYLIQLGSQKGDTILDPFTGSGTTCVAAKQLERNYIGIEREQEYVEIANARIAAI